MRQVLNFIKANIGITGLRIMMIIIFLLIITAIVIYIFIKMREQFELKKKNLIRCGLARRIYFCS